MRVSDAVDKRRSIRDFLDTPVPLEVIEDLLRGASRAPSGCNSQPWNVHVITGAKLEDLKKRTRAEAMANPAGENPEFQIFPDPMPDENYQRMFAFGAAMYGLLGIDRDDASGRRKAMLRNYEFFGAPVGLIVTIDRAAIDSNQWVFVGMFLQTFALLAVEKGLSTCMQEIWALYHKTVRASLQIPENKLIYCGVAIGHANWEAPVNSLRTERRTLEEFATFVR